MSERILVADDEQEIANLIALYLQNENYEVIQAYDGLQALEYVKSETLDLAVLDVMMPGMDGFSVCREIRKEYNYPVLMLTAKGEETDKINGLALGADDYITKPFLPLELVARVKAQLRRYKRYNSGMQEERDVLEHHGLILDKRTHQCILNEKKLSLTPTEFSVLQLLLEKKGAVVSSEEMFHHLWGDEYYNKNNNTITVHIRHLREKMNDSFENPKYIKTVWGCGYKIEK